MDSYDDMSYFDMAEEEQDIERPYPGGYNALPYMPEYNYPVQQYGFGTYPNKYNMNLYPYGYSAYNLPAGQGYGIPYAQDGYPYRSDERRRPFFGGFGFGFPFGFGHFPFGFGFGFPFGFPFGFI